MKRRLYRHPNALADVEEAAVYIGLESSESAMRFIDAVEKTMRLLSGNPGLGIARTLTRRKLLGLRSFPVKGFEKYLVFYLPHEHGIEVLRVLHGARDLPTVLEDEGFGRSYYGTRDDSDLVNELPDVSPALDYCEYFEPKQCYLVGS